MAGWHDKHGRRTLPDGHVVRAQLCVGGGVQPRRQRCAAFEVEEVAAILHNLPLLYHICITPRAPEQAGTLTPAASCSRLPRAGAAWCQRPPASASGAAATTYRRALQVLCMPHCLLRRVLHSNAVSQPSTLYTHHSSSLNGAYFAAFSWYIVSAFERICQTSKHSTTVC